MKKISLKIWPVLFLIVVWFIFASPYFIKRQAPFPSRYLVTFFPPWSAAYGMPVKNSAMPDVITQIYPWKKLTIDTWKKGQVPLWNPYSFSGTPQAANYQSAVYSPFNLLFFFLPMVEAWSISVLLQPLLAGFFMYFFLRTLERSQEGSLVGSLAFMFCGFLVVWMAYATLGYAVLWLPLILALIHRQFQRSSWWNLVVLSFVLALSFFSGHFQISLYVLSTVFLYLLFETVTTKKIYTCFQLLIMIVIGLLLASPQIFPAIVAYRDSIRSTIFEKSQGIPWHYLITFFSPDFYGNPVTRNDWLGSYAERAAFIGTVPFLLAIFAVFHKNKKIEEWFYIILAVLGLLIATPSPLNQLLYGLKVPVLSTSAANRIIVIVSFSLAALSAFGLDRLETDWRKDNHKPVIKFGVVVLVLTALLWLVLSKWSPLPPDKILIARRNIILPSIFAVSAAVLFMLAYLKNKLLRKAIIAIIIIIVAYDMLRFSGKWMPYDPKEFVFPPMAVGNFLQQKVGNNRVFGNIYNEFTGFNYLQSIIGYDAVYQSRYGKFISTATDGKIGMPERSVVNLAKYGLYSEKILELLGVKYLVHRLSDGRFGWAYPYWNYPFYNSVYKDEHYEVFENSKALPRVFLASSYKISTKDQEIIDLMFSPNFNLLDTVVLERRPVVEPQEGFGSVSIVNYQTNKVSISVNSQVPKLLFLSDVYDNGWQATVDGKATPVYRADYDFRAIAVPKGNHTIEFVYNPLSFRLGILIAAAVILILIIGSIKKLII